jgi:broad specificity phosphatase PhoE
LTTFYLLRHGEAQFEFADRFRLIGGTRDLVPLTPFGCKQIELAAEQLLDVGAQLILASPVTRALQSAAIVSRTLDLPLEVAYHLHEWLPDSTFTYQDSKVQDQAYLEMMDLGGEWPAGQRRDWEPVSSVRGRALGVLHQYSHLERVIVVCHYVVIWSLIQEKLDWAQFRAYHLDSPDVDK